MTRIVLALSLIPLTATAAPVELTHQGRLLDAAGAPTNGEIELGLALSTSAQASPFWEDTQPVTAADGYYTVTLGANGLLDSEDLATQTVWLTLSLGGTVSLGGTPLGEPQALLPVPYAVHAQSVSGRVQVGASTQACTASNEGLLRVEDSELWACLAEEWLPLANQPLGSSARNPGGSCADILDAHPGSADGTYWIDPDGSGAFEAACDMERGGWTLVLMVKNGDVTTFQYNSAQWSGTTALNGDVLDPTVDENVRSLAYSRMPVRELRFDLVTLGNSVVESVSASSARAVLTGSTRSVSRSRAEYLSWIDVASSNWNTQPYCNVRGFQVVTTGPAQCRYGIIMNNENDCNTSDSAVGFGCQTNNYSGGRTTAAGGHTWNPTVTYPRRGWIWAR